MTKDTARAIFWKCKCLIALAHYLLNTTASFRHNNVVLGFFQQDDIGKHFARFSMSAGCNYYRTAQHVAHTNAIDTARLLNECVDLDFNYRETVHICDLCDKQLPDSKLILLNDLPDNTSELTADDRLSLFYIGGYVAHKQTDEHCLSGRLEDLSPDILVFTASLNRGALISLSKDLYILLLHIFLFFKKYHRCLMQKTLYPNLQRFPITFPRKHHYLYAQLHLGDYCQHTDEAFRLPQSRRSQHRAKTEKSDKVIITVTSCFVRAWSISNFADLWM